MRFFDWFISKWKKKEIPEKEEKREEKNFYQYILSVNKILTYYRRDAGISRKKLELVVIDEPEQPAWQVHQILEQLIPELNLLYLVTERQEAYIDLAEEVLEERGLLMTLIPQMEEENLPGNLILDLREWRSQLDIIGNPA